MLYTTNISSARPGTSGNKSAAHAISLQPIAFNHDTCAYEGEYASKTQDHSQSDGEHPTDAKGPESV